MHSIKELELKEVLGVWENDIYILVITNKIATISKKIEEKSTDAYPITWYYISDKYDKMYNTIQISRNIYIYQLFENNTDEFVINYNSNNYEFHRVNFINEFNFYRSRIDIHQYIAIRWYNPWEYIALVEFYDFDIKRILRGHLKEERSEICNIYNSIIVFPDNWSKIDFKSCFPDYKQEAILETMKRKLCL